MLTVSTDETQQAQSTVKRFKCTHEQTGRKVFLSFVLSLVIITLCLDCSTHKLCQEPSRRSKDDCTDT